MILSQEGQILKIDPTSTDSAKALNAKAEAVIAKDDALAAKLNIEEELIHLVADVEVWSYDQGVLPDSTGAVEGIIGAYFKNDGVLIKVEWNGTAWIDIGEPISTKKYVDDKASLLAADIEAASKGIKPFETKALMDAFTPISTDEQIAKVYDDPTATNNGFYNWNGANWVKDAALTDVTILKNWVGAETFDSVTNKTFSDAGNLESADLIWLDGEAGTISNLVEDSEGRLTSLRYNRPDNKYITYNVSYDADGISTPTFNTTGY